MRYRQVSRSPARAGLRLAVALLLVSLSSAGIGAAGWTRTTSAHFDIYTTAGPKRALDALLYFEKVRAFFDRFLSLPPTSRAATRVILFSSEAEYAPYRISATAAAYYQPARERDYIVIGQFNGDSDPVIVHEYAHLAIDRSGATYPAWLSEGLAEFFSTMTPSRGKVLLGSAPLGRLPALSARATLLPITQLLAITQESPEYLADHSGVFYAESWALTHMLIASERYQAHADRFLSLVARGTPAAEAITAAYSTSIADVERELKRYVSRGFYRQLSVPGDLVVTAPPSTSEPIDPFDANLVLASLLGAGRNRGGQARAAFDTLARERPNDPALAVSRGLFEVLAGDEDAARTWLDRGYRAGARDPVALTELARLTELQDPARAGELLDAALALAPDNAFIRVRHAANLVSQHLGDAALDELRRIDPVPGDQLFLYFQVAANAHALLGHPDEAVAAATQVHQYARTEEERQFAASLLKGVRGPGGSTDMAEGRLNRITCDGAVPILEIITDKGLLHLAIDDATKVFMPGGGSANLECGPQSRLLRVGYIRENPPAGTNGRVRFLDFKEAAPACMLLLPCPPPQA